MIGETCWGFSTGREAVEGDFRGKGSRKDKNTEVYDKELFSKTYHGQLSGVEMERRLGVKRL